MKDPALHERTALELARLVSDGAVSCRDVVEAHLARIEALEPRQGAVVLPLQGAARAAADAADRSPTRGPLQGVPFTVKVTIDCLGSPTTLGLSALRDALPYADAPAVERLKAAGAILIGRTNSSELALRLCTVSPLHGRTLNPFDPALTIGGSSGGDACAVATGMAPIGLGIDMGGSLRVPARCAGVATLKPTTGRVPHASSLEPRDHGMAAQVMLAVGPLARSVADLRVLLGVLAGRSPLDPRSVDAPLVGPVRQRRAALVTSHLGAPLAPPLRRPIERAGVALEAAGWSVEEAEPPELERTGEVFARLLATDLEPQLPELQRFVSDSLLEHLERIVGSARLHEISNHRLHAERSRLARQWSRFFIDYPVLVTPTWGCPVWRVDADMNPSSGLSLLRETTRFILPGNVLGLPCVTLPMCSQTQPGALPDSISIYADLWREDLCLAAAEVIEAAVGRRAPVEPLAPHP
jgi:amidase